MKVLVAGAGPSGLVLGLWLARRGVKARIVDKAKGPGETSRAMGVHARTLEFYRQLGFADKVVEQGIAARDFQLFEHGQQVAKLDISEFGEGISPYPFILSYPQDEHERFLGGRLREAGNDIEWQTSLENLVQREDKVLATLNGETEEFDYVCGCDGSHSTVRVQVGIGFPGETYQVVFYVADVTAEGAVSDTGFRAHFAKDMIQLALPIRSNGHYRLIGMVPRDEVDNKDLTFEDVRKQVEEIADIQVKTVQWFSRYRVHHRVAESFRVGRCFLLGDAGHIHSPVGGQGMNTGIGDAVNLAWKLAEVDRGADPSLLDSYEPERIAFARILVTTTDQVFQSVIDRGWKGLAFRELFLQHILPYALGFPAAKHAAFRLLSQTRIDYRQSPMSDGKAGDVHGGDRLPWTGDNFDALQSLEWQVHVYGDPPGDLGDVPVHVFPWTEKCGTEGLMKNACYLVRPDGYVALADPKPDKPRIEKFLSSARGQPSAPYNRASLLSPASSNG